MKLGKNQKLIINTLKNNQILTTDKLRIENYSVADSKRLVEQLENKGLIEVINGRIKLKKNLEYDFSKKEQRINFFYICKLQKVFKSNNNSNQISFLDDINSNQIEFLLIENQSNYQKFYDYNFNNNKSLEIIKNKDPKNWQRLYKSGLEKMKYQIDLVQSRVKSWSENKYNLVYKENILKQERLYIERKNISKLKLLKDTSKAISKEKTLLEYEMTFMLYQLIHELIDIAYTSKKNYQEDFFSSDSLVSF